jgi:hypothetical protein
MCGFYLAFHSLVQKMFSVQTYLLVRESRTINAAFASNPPSQTPHSTRVIFPLKYPWNILENRFFNVLEKISCMNSDHQR